MFPKHNVDPSSLEEGVFVSSTGVLFQKATF